MMIYQSNALYSYIPKNACSTLRFSVAKANGCISSLEQGHWIHANNTVFNATLAEAIKASYTFVILRCPYRRLASAYLDEFLLYDEYTAYFSLENFANTTDTLKNEIDLDIIDARTLTNHGVDGYEIFNDRCYADTAAFDIAVMKRDGRCPAHAALYDADLYHAVHKLYRQDIELYDEKCDSNNLLKQTDLPHPGA